MTLSTIFFGSLPANFSMPNPDYVPYVNGQDEKLSGELTSYVGIQDQALSSNLTGYVSEQDQALSNGLTAYVNDAIKACAKYRGIVSATNDQTDIEALDAQLSGNLVSGDIAMSRGKGYVYDETNGWQPLGNESSLRDTDDTIQAISRNAARMHYQFNTANTPSLDMMHGHNIGFTPSALGISNGGYIRSFSVSTHNGAQTPFTAPLYAFLYNESSTPLTDQMTEDQIDALLDDSISSTLAVAGPVVGPIAGERRTGDACKFTFTFNRDVPLSADAKYRIRFSMSSTKFEAPNFTTLLMTSSQVQDNSGLWYIAPGEHLQPTMQVVWSDGTTLSSHMNGGGGQPVDLSDYYTKSETSSAAEIDAILSARLCISADTENANAWNNLDLEHSPGSNSAAIVFDLSAFGIVGDARLDTATFTLINQGDSYTYKAALFLAIDDSYEFLFDLSNAIVVSDPIEISANSSASGNPQDPYDVTFTFDWTSISSYMKHNLRYCLSFYNASNDTYRTISYDSYTASQSNDSLHSIMNAKVIPRMSITYSYPSILAYPGMTALPMYYNALRGKQYKIGPSTEWMKNALLDVIYAMGGTAVDEPVAVS